MAWLAVAREVGGRGTCDETHLADPPRDERLVRQVAGAHDAVHVLGHEIDRTVGDAEIDLNVGIPGVKLRQGGQNDQQGNRGTDIDADAPLGLAWDTVMLPSSSSRSASRRTTRS